MNLRILPLLVLSASFGLVAQDFTKLPDWAVPHARAAAAEPVPAGDPDAWVVLDRTEVAYGGDNEIWTHRYRLVKILGERGLGQGTFTISGVGGRGNRVKKLKGWNLRPDGELLKLDQDTVITIEDAGDEAFSRSTMTGAVLPRVAKGSWVAFESLQVAKLPFGPIDGAFVMESFPIRTWELEVGMRSGWFSNPKPVDIRIDALHVSPFLTQVTQEPGKRIRALAVPPLPKDEGSHPFLGEVLPQVVVRFLDPVLTEAPVWSTWDGPATWFAKAYRLRTHPGGAPVKGSADLASLQRLWSWMGHELTYKAVYLTPDRGWVPEDASEVFRKRYGDCKDLSTFFLGEAQGLGFQGAPALARIVTGRIVSTEVPSNVFNHVIAALRLERSLGLPAEVETPRGRFLLVDATDPLTPLGHLGSAHRGGQVMICLPEGAVWVKVPATAILEDRTELVFEGTADAAGALKGTLIIRESGDDHGLRSVTRRGGKSALRDLILARRLDLPPTGTLEVVSVSDPLDLAAPLEVKVNLTHPQGFRSEGTERVLTNLGLFLVPAQIQKPGVARIYPVEADRASHLRFRARVDVAGRVAPVLPTKEGKSPFRAFTWKATAAPQAGGTRLELDFEHTYLSATFPIPEQEKGVQEWKKDRTLIRNLLSDGLAFKVEP